MNILRVKSSTFIILLLLTFSGAHCQAADESILSGRLIGKSGIYTTTRREPLRLVAARLGCDPAHLAAMNDLPFNALLQKGQKIRYSNLRIVPPSRGKQIVINIPDRTLYLYDSDGKLISHAPVAAGKPTTPTPIGDFKVTVKQKDPEWRVPMSIQQEMASQGKPVVQTVPPGPDNPLGRHVIRTSISEILIHGTVKPGSIYGFNSHGCIRLDADRIEKLYTLVSPGMKGDIRYSPVKLAGKPDGRVFIEVHRDVYGKGDISVAAVRELFRRAGLEDKADWNRVTRALTAKSGVAVEVGRKG